MTTRILLCSALALGLTVTAGADDDLWFGVKAGTLGLGVEATWRPVPYLDLRAGANAFSLDQDRSEAGIDYEAEVDLSSFYATANLRVPLSPFRVTAGLFANGNEVSFRSVDSASFEIGGETFTADQIGSLRGSAGFDDIAPYVGVGLDFRIFDTFGLHLDAGVLRQGSAQVSLAADGPIAQDPLFLDALETERQELEASVDDYDLYPVVSLGFSVNF